jgi:hypothetical protein
LIRPWLTVLTCSKRPEYLGATIASLDRAGARAFRGERIVFVDGDASGIKAPGWRICQLHPDRLGVKEASFAVLRTAARAGVPHLIYTEDDCVYTRGAIRAIAEIPIPSDVGFLSYCDIKGVAREPGITVAPGYDYTAEWGRGGHWGNQCVSIPGRSLPRLLTGRLTDWTLPARASDILLGMLYEKYGVFYPSLAQHVGDRSLVQDAGSNLTMPNRVSAHFPGVDFDAATLGRKGVPLHVARPPAAARTTRHSSLSLNNTKRRIGDG